jgi:hypothetical protein
MFSSGWAVTNLIIDALVKGKKSFPLDGRWFGWGGDNGFFTKSS